MNKIWNKTWQETYSKIISSHCRKKYSYHICYSKKVRHWLRLECVWLRCITCSHQGSENLMLHKNQYCQQKSPRLNHDISYRNKNNQKPYMTNENRGCKMIYFIKIEAELFPRCSLLFTCCSLLSARCSLLFARCSLFFARCSLLFRPLYVMKV